MADYVPSVLGSIMKAIACTPNSNEDEQAYEQGVLVPARKIRKLWDELGDQRPTDDQIRESIQGLQLVFETKRTDPDERNDRLREIIEMHGLETLFPELTKAVSART
jgi:[acyl-carrier-protein] S-malonyltransferase